MKVKVWNDNELDHTEKFRGSVVHVPSRGFIEMEESDAKEFRTQFFPPIRSEVSIDGIDPKSRKMIRIEYPGGARPIAKAEPELRSPLTGEVFANEKDYKKHLDENKDKVHRDPEVEKQIKTDLEAKAAALGFKLEQMGPVSAEPEKKSRGRQKKSA